MEIRRACTFRCLVFFACLLFAMPGLNAQPPNTYTIKNGRMYVQLGKPIKAATLDSFILQFDLADLDLKTFLTSNNPDSLDHLGWKVEINNEVGLVISKAMEPFGELKKLDERFFYKDRKNPLFPAVNNGLTFGVNRFRNKQPFATRDSLVRFFLRNHQGAQQVRLAGSFNNWVPDQLSMQKTDSGWIYDVVLSPGKYWYKFIVDGAWIVDRDNQLAENDGRGNINSVFFRTNVVFFLDGYHGAKNAFLAGSFNNWKPGELPMTKTATGWTLSIYLAEGTHTYKFVVDSQWVADRQNPETVADGTGGENSVIRKGKSVLFQLTGFPDAKEVMLLGSFNQWRDFEWRMEKRAGGWQLSFTLGPGNHAYKFKIDGKVVSDPANPLTSARTGNSFLILQPNHRFQLKGFGKADRVYLAGDFNNWDPVAFPMQKKEDSWEFPVHLTVGKHLYKFIIDGKWIIDPGNKLWEDNEYGTGNSVIWIEQ